MKVECGDLPAALASVIRSAIAYEKEKRPGSASAFAEAVRAAL